jgi:hypothetical protein
VNVSEYQKLLNEGHQNDLKKEDASSPLLLNFALEYAMRKVQEDQVGHKLNGKHHLLLCTDNVNLLGSSIYAIKKKTQKLSFMLVKRLG